MLSRYVSIGSCQPGHYIFIVLVFVLVVFDPSSADLYLSFPIDIVLVFVVVLFVVVLCMFKKNDSIVSFGSRAVSSPLSSQYFHISDRYRFSFDFECPSSDPTLDLSRYRFRSYSHYPFASTINN